MLSLNKIQLADIPTPAGPTPSQLGSSPARGQTLIPLEDIQRRKYNVCEHVILATSIIGITRGNFRLIRLLLMQVEQILQINEMRVVTKEAVEATRENLIIGQA